MGEFSHVSPLNFYEQSKHIKALFYYNLRNQNVNTYIIKLHIRGGHLYSSE